MASRPRVLPFSGDDDAYNQYLEQFFLTVKSRHPSTFVETCSLISAPSCGVKDPSAGLPDTQLATNTEQENSPLQICHYDPSLPQTTDEALRATPRSTRLLERIPKTEKDWQKARHQLGFENSQQILSYLSRIQGCAWRFEQNGLTDYSITALGKQAIVFTQELSGLSGFVALISFLFFVACCFDKNTGADKLEVEAAMKAFLDVQQKDCKLGGNTRVLAKIMAGTLKVVALIDRLYDKLKHRAFELLFYLAPSPTDLCHLTLKEVDYIESCVKAWEPIEEVQARAPLYVVFLLQWWRPTKTLAEIREALGTCLFGNTESNPLSQLILSAESLKRKRDEIDHTTNDQNIELGKSPSSRPRLSTTTQSISSDRSPSYFSNSNISVDTNSTMVSGGERPLSSGRGPMLCSDPGIEEEARNLPSFSLSNNIRLETGILPSHDIRWDEADDWLCGIEVERIGPNATEEFYAI